MYTGVILNRLDTVPDLPDSKMVYTFNCSIGLSQSTYDRLLGPEDPVSVY